MKLTPRVVAYIASEEGLVDEAYKDSKGIWTWALGVTNVSSHEVYPRYLDKPQPLEKCLEISIWLLENHYLPGVEAAFPAAGLSEAQLAGALSFHWNCGSIKRAEWVKAWNKGQTGKAQLLFDNWKEPASRRKREKNLFFRGIWPSDLNAPVYEVRKPQYTPYKPRSVNLLPILESMMGGH